MVKNLPASAGDRRHEFSCWVGKILWGRAWQPTPSHEQRSVVVYGVARESDTTEVTWHIWLNYLPYAVVVLLEGYFDN